MNHIVHLFQAENTNQSISDIAQGVYDFVSFKSMGDLLDIKFDISLNDQDVKAIDQQIWA